MMENQTVKNIKLYWNTSNNIQVKCKNNTLMLHKFELYWKLIFNTMTMGNTVKYSHITVN